MHYVDDSPTQQNSHDLPWMHEHFQSLLCGYSSCSKDAVYLVVLHKELPHNEVPP